MRHICNPMKLANKIFLKRHHENLACRNQFGERLQINDTVICKIDGFELIPFFSQIHSQSPAKKTKNPISCSLAHQSPTKIIGKESPSMPKFPPKSKNKKNFPTMFSPCPPKRHSSWRLKKGLKRVLTPEKRHCHWRKNSIYGKNLTPKTWIK